MALHTTTPPSPDAEETLRAVPSSGRLRSDRDGAIRFRVLARAIGGNPDLCALLLREANSVLHAPRTPILGVREAVVRLGLARVRQILRAQAPRQ